MQLRSFILRPVDINSEEDTATSTSNSTTSTAAHFTSMSRRLVPPTPPTTPSAGLPQMKQSRGDSSIALSHHIRTSSSEMKAPLALSIHVGEEDSSSMSPIVFDSKLFESNAEESDSKSYVSLDCTQAAGITDAYSSFISTNSNDGNGDVDSRKSSIACMLYLKHRTRLLQHQLNESKEEREREKATAQNLFERLRAENATLQARLSDYEETRLSPALREEEQKVSSSSDHHLPSSSSTSIESLKSWYEEQLNDADENLGMTLQSFQSTVATLQAEISSLQQEKLSLEKQLQEAATNHELIQARCEKKTTKLAGFMARFEMELTTYKIQNKGLLEHCRELQEENEKLKVGLGREGARLLRLHDFGAYIAPVASPNQLQFTTALAHSPRRHRTRVESGSSTPTSPL